MAEKVKDWRLFLRFIDNKDVVPSDQKQELVDSISNDDLISFIADIDPKVVKAAI